jgi:branched-chain amino acid aminotransferase
MRAFSSRVCVFVDGKPADPEAVRADFFCEEGNTVFESMKLSGGVVFQFAEHMERLAASAKTAGVSLPASVSGIAQKYSSVLASLRLSGDAFVRLTLTSKHFYLTVTPHALPSWIHEKGVAVKTSVIRRHHPRAVAAEAKTGNFLNGILGGLDFPARKPFTLLMLDFEGYVCEAAVQNIFIVREQVLQTPPPAGILDGVTKRFVLRCAGKESLAVQSTRFTRHDVWNAEEAFLTNTSGDMVPIRSLDGRNIGRLVPGPVTKRLMRRFQLERNRSLGVL